MLIRVKDAVKKYGKGETEVYALDHAELELDEGKICVILGPSGSGKSTLLNMLGGLDTLDSGELTVAGRKVTGLSQEQRTDYRKEDAVSYTHLDIFFFNLRLAIRVAENGIIAPGDCFVVYALQQEGIVGVGYIGNDDPQIPRFLSL